jgi:hypothetical protein
MVSVLSIIIGTAHVIAALRADQLALQAGEAFAADGAVEHRFALVLRRGSLSILRLVHELEIIPPVKGAIMFARI